jgi:hypothetical protein
MLKRKVYPETIQNGMQSNVTKPLQPAHTIHNAEAETG